MGIIEIKLKTDNSINNISMTNSYAPHHGYDNEEQNKYWETINEHLQNIPKNYIKCWCTDNNGQVSKSDIHNNIGDWAIANKNTEPNGINLAKTCEENDLIISNSFIQLKKGEKERLATW